MKKIDKKILMWTLLMLPPAFLGFCLIMCIFFSPPSIIGRWQGNNYQSQLLFQTNNVVVVIDVDQDGVRSETKGTYGILKGGIRLYFKNSDSRNLLTLRKGDLQWREKKTTYFQLEN